MDNFDRALDFVLAREGGYSNDVNDPGGETRYGICRRYHPDLDIKNLTIKQAADIYRKEYWDPLDCDQMPYWAALATFDTAVNMGRAHAMACLAKTARMDGTTKLTSELGRVIRHMEPEDGLADYLSYRLIRYASLSGWQRFGRGWAKRCALLAMEAFGDRRIGV
jgi:lysozyme family protein